MINLTHAQMEELAKSIYWSNYTLSYDEPGVKIGVTGNFQRILDRDKAWSMTSDAQRYMARYQAMCAIAEINRQTGRLP